MAVFTPVADPAGISAVQDVLKEVWVSDSLESQLFDDNILADWIEDVQEYTDSSGLRASVPLKTGRTGGVSARAIGQQLGVADHQRVAKATYDYKNLYLQVQVYGPVIAKMKTDRQACVREIDFEVKNGLEDFRKDYARQLRGDGSAKLTLAALPGGASSTTVLLGTGNYSLIDRGILYEGQRIDIGTAASPTLDTGGNRIASIVDSTSAPAIVLDNATATTAGSHISLTGNRTAGSVSNEINGLRGVISDTAALGGLDPSTAVYWKSVREHNSGTPRALSIDLMLTTMRKVRQKGAMPEVLYGDLVQEQAYYKLLQGQVRFMGDNNLASGNTEGLPFGKARFVADPDADPGRIYFLKKGALQMFSAGPVAWQNQTTGGDILAWRQDYDAFVARAAKYCDLGSDRRRSLGVLDDLS